ncbi:MAG: DUF6737 family protein [Cyanobacteriota bacterium ELA615]
MNNQKDFKIWDYKPWWCQPWSILSCGIGAIAFSWFLFGNLWLTGGLSLMILLWWYYFLILYPRLIKQSLKD